MLNVKFNVEKAMNLGNKSLQEKVDYQLINNILIINKDVIID